MDVLPRRQLVLRGRGLNRDLATTGKVSQKRLQFKLRNAEGTSLEFLVDHMFYFKLSDTVDERNL